MNTTTPPRFKAKNEKNAPVKDAMSQYSLVNIAFNFSNLARSTIALPWTNSN
jgi:hypothetical protein